MCSWVRSAVTCWSTRCSDRHRPRLSAWEEGDGSVTTVTFEEKDGRTLVVLRELYPSKEALDAAGTGAAEALSETFAQLDGLLADRAPDQA